MGMLLAARTLPQWDTGLVPVELTAVVGALDDAVRGTGPSIADAPDLVTVPEVCVHTLPCPKVFLIEGSPPASCIE